MRRAEDISDIQYEQKQDDEQEIIQRIEDVLNMGRLTRMNFFDALVEVYNLARSDEHEAMINNWPDWISEIRDEVCKGGD